MSKKTPTKKQHVDVEVKGFSPVTVPRSPAETQCNLTGVPRVARDVAADVHNNIQKWNGYHVKGAEVVRDIGKLMSDNPRKLTPEVETLTFELRTIVDNLQIYAKALEFLANQMTALENLHKGQPPLFVSLTVEQLSDIVHRIAEAYRGELKRKEYILENLVFSRDRHELMFYASCWTYQEYISKCKAKMKLETLLMETGHRKVT